MIDIDGIERPDDFHAHEDIIKHDPKIKIDDSYDERTRNPFKIVYRNTLMFIITILLNFYYYFYLKLRVKNRKNLRGLSDKKVVVAINHTCVMDVPIVVFNLFPVRRCFYVVIRENLQVPIIRHIVKIGGGIPKPKDLSTTLKFDKQITKLIENKNPVIFAREGSLWSCYRGYRPPLRGVYAYASKTEATVVPVTYTYRKHKKIFSKGYKYYPTCNIGEPVSSDPELSKRENEAYFEETVENQIKKIIKDTYKGQ